MNHNGMEATKNIYCAKDEDAVNHSTVQEISLRLQEPW